MNTKYIHIIIDINTHRSTQLSNHDNNNNNDREWSFLNVNTNNPPLPSLLTPETSRERTASTLYLNNATCIYYVIRVTWITYVCNVISCLIMIDNNMYYMQIMESTSSRNRSSSTNNISQEAENFLHTKIPEMVWEAGSKRMKDTLSSYGRIDLFRPYFDVEPRQVRNRLIQSFIPRKPSQMNISNDMYGPTMILLTLVALLLCSMKSSGYTVQDGTLIGTAMVTCFGAWDIPYVAISLYLCSRAHECIHKLAIIATTYILHLSYLCYLHYGFHVVVEEIDGILGDMQQSQVTSLPSIT
ncbi:Protein YIPF3 [Dirofilaria immitis]|nr:Protein YIPF3 [Dirofilaria immitis]